MPTVAFDFDSTLIPVESLDELLAEVLAGKPEAAEEVRKITVAGMEGRVPFVDSIRRRLALARPSRAQVEAFGRRAADLLTPGLPEAIAGLRADVWIVSGALREALLPSAERLGVPPERIVSTRARWNGDGSMADLAEVAEKHEQLAPHAARWARPRVLVGDGMSDYAVHRAGLVEHFVAFTAHARRAPVVATGAPEARSVAELEYLLARIL